MRVQSIRARLTRIVLVVFFIAVTLGIGGIYALFRLALINQFVSGLQARAASIYTLVIQNGAAGGPDYVTRLAPIDFGDGVQGLFELWKMDGTVLVRSKYLRGHDLPRVTGATSWLDSRSTCLSGKPPLTTVDLIVWRVARAMSWPCWSFRNVNLSDGRALTIVDLIVPPQEYVGWLQAAERAPAAVRPSNEKEDAAIRPSNPPPGSMLLSVALDHSQLDVLVTWLALICGATVILLSAAALLIPPMLRRQLRPLDQMAEQTRAIDAQSLATRLPTDGLPAELQPIANYLNDLFARLESSFERERRVTADLAHELRTPLAELRTWTESALKWPQSRDPATDQEIMGAARHMEAIVTHMLALARSEGSTIPLTIEQVDVPALLEQAWRSFEPQARVKNLRVEWHLNPVSCETDPALLRSILTNLFDNAVEYTPVGGMVRIACGMQAGHASIQIANTVANLDQQDVARFFERFWRKEEARSGEQHVGLGLAIAQSFAQALGWQLGATLDEGHLITFVLKSR